MPIQAIQNRRLYQQIADQLLEAIERGEYRPGSTLPPERELAKLLNVSRTSVREALLALEIRGAVRVRVGSGVEVLAPSPDTGGATPAAVGTDIGWEPDPELDAELGPPVTLDIPPFALLEARALVEPEAAALAAGNASDAQLAAIRAAYEHNVRDNREGSKTHPGDRLFHIRIAEASGNPAYHALLRHLLGHRYSEMFRRMQALYTPDDMPHRSEREHQAILDALEARDAARARKAMRAHLDSVIGIFTRA
ncbi:FadR/GntR family transcriptional regulator [Solimonas marina]|uniref:FadR family transcriptional regulator n=1 Tax=Solimonas marina TaxID=2714601 RepID=A0A970B7U3_9GAMM|nr:FCD domain-containing protein [Solimonas marina]NKF24050.1 FadR family transcriptional regulator [Solimonas marina]